MEAVSILGGLCIMASFIGAWVARSPLMISYELRDSDYVRVKRVPYMMNGKLFLSMERPLSTLEDATLRDQLSEAITPDHSLTLISNPSLFHSLEKSRHPH